MEEKKSKGMKTTSRIVIIILLLCVAAVVFYKERQNWKQLLGRDNSSFSVEESFAEYNLENTKFEAKLPDYTIDYKELSNLANFEQAEGKEFSSAQREALNSDHFFVKENLDKFYRDDPEEEVYDRVDDWIGLYEKIGGSRSADHRKPENAAFITSDYALHVFHKLLEKEFEYIEQKKLYPTLKEMTDSLFNQAVESYGSVNSENKKSYERIIAYFAIPKAMLDAVQGEFESSNIENQDSDTKENILAVLETLKSSIPQKSYDLAKAELELVLEQSRTATSPLFGSLLAEEGLEESSDYTQYTPRSRYNKNSVLRSYFMAMMWYGRNNFVVKSEELTRDALNITLLFKNTNQQKNWEDIYLPTSFFVGNSDDLGVVEYSKVLQDLKIKKVNTKAIQRAQEEIKKLEGPKIMSSVMMGDKIFDLSKEELQEKTKGFRFMGQRFTPDAFVFTTLTQGDEKPDEETGESLPSTTSALMVMSVLGNETAEPFVEEWIDENAPNSKQVLANRLKTLTIQFNSIQQDIWTQNIYWSWLYTIRSLDSKSLNKQGYPEFVKKDAWDKKNLQTSLGSWTELKHDTLLYAKQSYAEKGGGGPGGDLPPVPKGYVEPNIAFWDRIIALSEMTMEGLRERDLLDDIFFGRNEKFISSLRFFRDIAVKQLQDEIISDEDYERLRTEWLRLETVLEPLADELYTEEKVRSALIADVHTDSLGGTILYEATGIPNYIYVAVKDRNGTRLTKGLVFSHYEFEGSLGERLTDEKWQEVNYRENKDQLPVMPSWSKSLIK